MEVDVEGRLVKPWVTWFIDVATDVACGTAVTPGASSRESILAALRVAITLEAPYGPPGGLPGRVRIDLGRDFLSETVGAVMAGFGVTVGALPPYTPHVKGTVETVNSAAGHMFFAGLPRYTGAQTLADGRPVDPEAPALTFEAFVAELLGWVRWWNTEHQMPVLEGRTPLQAWLEDPTPLSIVLAGDLRLLMLEDDGRHRKITTRGVAWRGRWYVGAWMTGQVARPVRLRHMPHHEHEIEVFDARTQEHLGAATLADRASPEQIAELRRARESAGGSWRRRCVRPRRAAGSGTRPPPRRDLRSRSPRSPQPPRPRPRSATPTPSGCGPRPGHCSCRCGRRSRAGYCPGSRRQCHLPKLRTPLPAKKSRPMTRGRDRRSDVGGHRRAG